MSLQQVGYTGLAIASLAATAITENLGIAVLGIALLVSMSTLLIRIGSLLDRRVDANLNRKMVTGDLPTKLERQETQRTLEELTQTLADLVKERHD